MEEEQLHLSFKAEMESCPSDSVFCLVCHLAHGSANAMKTDTVSFPFGFQFLKEIKKSLSAKMFRRGFFK